jgi:DNA-binding CsgD family transcriptional regulator
MPTPRFNARREEARRLYAEGMTKAAIARHLNVSRATVYGWVPSEVGGSAVNTELRRRCADLGEQGYSRSEIARAVGVSRQRVSQVMGPINPDEPIKDKSVVLYSTPEKVRALRVIAKSFGLVAERGRYPTAGSIQKLLDAIAIGDLAVSKKPKNFPPTA